MMLDDGIYGVGAHRAIDFRGAGRGGLGAGGCLSCHGSILLHQYRRISPEKGSGYF
jgi:hypothetical protein